MNKSTVLLALGLLFVSTSSAFSIGNFLGKLKSLNQKKESLGQSAFPIPYIPDEYEQKGRRYLLNNETNELEDLESAFIRKVSIPKNAMAESTLWWQENENGTMEWELVSFDTFNATTGITLSYQPENNDTCVTYDEEPYTLEEY